jgi:hypothetical protein
MGQKERLLRRALGVFTTLAVLMLMLPFTGSVALGSSVEPETVDGNPTCGDFTDGGIEFKIENPGDGTYTHDDFSVDLAVYETSMGPEFDWSSNLGVDVVVAKGGPNANVYRYNPTVTGDKGLHSPVNPSGEWCGLSHISFCYIEGATITTEAADTTTTVETTTTELETTTTRIEPTTLQSGPTSSEVPTTAHASTTTIIEAEVLPTQLTTSTTAAEVFPAEELPFTGMPTLRLWVLGLSLVGAGVTALALEREQRT